jgi:hypothetical protein
MLRDIVDMYTAKDKKVIALAAMMSVNRPIRSGLEDAVRVSVLCVFTVL